MVLGTVVIVKMFYYHVVFNNELLNVHILYSTLSSTKGLLTEDKLTIKLIIYYNIHKY